MLRRRVRARGCPGRRGPRSLAAGAARAPEETSAGLAGLVPRRRYRTSTQKLTFVSQPFEWILVPQIRARHYINARDPSRLPCHFQASEGRLAQARPAAAEPIGGTAARRGRRPGRGRRSRCASCWVHMIEEYARHNGHADLLRERIDGRVGQQHTPRCTRGTPPGACPGRWRAAEVIEGLVRARLRPWMMSLPARWAGSPRTVSS
jgi:hypothetical protein